MSMNDEVEQIILRSILKDGLDAVPQDYQFITKYDLKQIYFSKIEYHAWNRNRYKIFYTRETQKSNY